MKSYSIRVLILFVILPPLLGLFGKYHWVFDLFSHFRVQQVLLLVVCLIVLIFLRAWRRAVVVGVALIFFGLPLIDYFPINKSVEVYSNEGTVGILYANVGSSNKQHDRVIGILKEERPDIFIISEINDRWEEVITPYLKDYRFREVHKRKDNFGLAVYSKIPLEELKKAPLGSVQVPAIRCVLKQEGRAVTLWAVHPLPPVGKDYWAWRNEDLKALANKLAKDSQAKIVMGDLNLTPWSWWYKMLENERLVDSAQNRGFSFTWPSYWPKILRIPIDHALVSQDIEVIERRVLRFTGSDHFPLFLRIKI